MKNQPPKLPVDLLRRIDTACDQFEESWRKGAGPRVEEYLSRFQVDERAQLLDALQGLQQELICSQVPVPQSVPKTTELNVSVIDDRASTDRPAEDEFKTPVELQSLERNARVTFRVIEGPHAGTGFTFEEHDTLFAGRLTKAQLRLEKDLHFSRHHFRIEVNPPTCFLMDLNSRNGTFINGERVKERFLRDGDVISGGRTKMVVSIFDPKASATDLADQTLITDAPNPPDIERGLPVPSRQNAVQKNLAPVESGLPIAPPGYEFHKKIGEGDLGIVYRASRLSDQELCAVKMLSPAAHSDENAIQAFLREASVLNQLQHPHIIRLLDMGAVGRNVFLALEYVHSISWPRLVSRYTSEKRIRIACALMSQILGALEYAHARSLVHRDVKPGNILIVKKENKLLAKLADFGLAKQYTTAGMSQVTRDGDVLGSLPFMSPDQFLNSREAKPTCDIYSAAATLYWMLTGHEPIPIEGHPCKFLAILEDPPTPIRQHNPAIPEPLARVVHRALEKTADKRFASASEMRYSLRPFLK